LTLERPWTKFKFKANPKIKTNFNRRTRVSVADIPSEPSKLRWWCASSRWSRLL